jgi:hypothetical protein
MTIFAGLTLSLSAAALLAGTISTSNAQSLTATNPLPAAAQAPSVSLPTRTGSASRAVVDGPVTNAVTSNTVIHIPSTLTREIKLTGSGAAADYGLAKPGSIPTSLRNGPSVRSDLGVRFIRLLESCLSDFLSC